MPRPSANSPKPAAVSKRALARCSRATATGRHQQLGDAGDQHDRPDLERVVPPDEGEEYRHQVDRAEQADPEDEAQDAADRETPVGESA